MEKRIARQTPRTLRLGAAILLMALSLPGAALAFKSAYSSISMPGEFDSGPQWDTGTHQLALVSDYVWQGVINVTKQGKFKFAANNGWDVNWGLGQEVSTVPTEDMGPLVRGGNDISLKLAAGKYRFVFFEDTSTFSVLPQASSVPAYSSVKLIGSFNDEGAIDTGAMTSKGSGKWTATVDLSYGATVRVNADGTIFGAHSAQGAVLSAMPATVALYGTTETVLQSAGGTFEFTMDFRSNQLSVVQTATNAFTLAAASADGTFACSTNLPGQNLENAGDNWWSGEFQVEQSSFTLRFVGRDKDGIPGRWWGFPAGTVISASALPTNGVLTWTDSASEAATATVSAGKGDYTFRFNPQSGSYTIRKNDRANLLKNPSFEEVDGYGNPFNWGLYHAGSGPASVYDAHSGTNSALLNRLYEDWDNLGNIDQDVTLKNQEGLPFRVSASFRCGGSAWHGDTVRIIIEWKNAASGAFIGEESTEVLNLSPAWQTVALDTAVPGSNVTAHILFKYDGAQLGETVLIDDAFAGIAASRTQNFDAWGRHDDFGPLSPDWMASRAKTILNAAATIPGGVLISRYIESVGNTKAIEIFNGTSAAINLKNNPYYLQQYDNGSSTPTVTIPLTNGTIPAGRTFAVTRTFNATNYPPDSALRNFGAINGLANRILRTDALTFNGDDVIVLRRGSATGDVVDRVGQVSANATGSLWSRMASDHTLVRNGTVTNGNTSALTSAFDLSEWTVLDNGEFGDLGAHAFTDPDAGYLPSGYSLLLDTNANLMTPSLEGGIGDISFLARAQGAASGSDLQLAVETASDEYSTSWTRVATVSIPLSQTEFTRHECAAGNSAHTVVRFRHLGDGTTNRIRLDDIEVGRAYRIKRTENFAAWTDAAYKTDGLHTIAQWTVNGRIAANGVSATLAANLPIDSGYVQTPTFDGGVGQITFALCRPAATDSVQVTLSSSADGGATWQEVQTFDFPAGGKGTTTNLSAWVYIPSNGCARFVCTGGTADAILDNISVGMPSTSRELDFEDFSPNSSYLTYSYKGWTITDTAINNSTNAWSGNSGVVREGTLTSPWIDTLGSISFMYRKGPYGGDEKARLKVEVSADGRTWKTLTASLEGGAQWQTYGYWFDEGTDWHYARFTQTTSKQRFLLDDINLADFQPVPSVNLYAAVDPKFPEPNEPFRITASVYPRNGADILSVTGFARFSAAGLPKGYAMEQAEEYGDYATDEQPGRSARETIYYWVTVWYGGVGVVPGNPGYAVTNISSPEASVKVENAVGEGVLRINELNYERIVPSPLTTNEWVLKWNDDLTDDWGIQWNQDHEYVELMGIAGTDIGGWTIELAYALASDIASNGGAAVYASYTIPKNYILPELLDDSGNPTGYGIYLLGDSFITNVHQKLTTLVPVDDDGWGMRRSHICDWAGVIRLLSPRGQVVQSLSYGAYTEDSKRIPVQQSTGVNNEYALSVTSVSGSSTRWEQAGASPGRYNIGQNIGPATANPIPIWHDPNLTVTTRLQNAFALFNPLGAPQSAAVQVFFAYPTNIFRDYGDLAGTLHHRREGASSWQKVAKRNDFTGNDNKPANGYAYFAFQALGAYTYDRLDTMEYVIEARVTDGSDYDDTYLGSTGDGVTCTNYTTLERAQETPFKHFFRIADVIVITNLVFSADGEIKLETTGNDPLDRLTEFNVLSTTNLAMPVDEWEELPFDRSDDGLEHDTFILRPPKEPGRHFAIQPVR